MLHDFDVDYLHWLQKNTKSYWVIMGLIVFLLGLNGYYYWQERSDPIAEESVQQKVEEPGMTEEQLVVESPLMALEDTVQPPAAEMQVEVEEETPVPQGAVPELPAQEYVDPLSLEGYQIPCSGKLVSSFGLSFDEIYGDYRYHQGVSYQPAGEQVVAVLAGRVINSYSENGIQKLVIDDGEYQLIYHGLEQISVNVDDQVGAGEPIGSTGQLLTIEALH